MPLKTQRVRDPLHDMITFDGEEFEDSLWSVVQTRPFQRLRRVKQLGFSELTFPGATHTRFAHSLGVFHTARELMSVIKRHTSGRDIQWGETDAKIALAAALVHDVGHGMFSHAFEAVGKRLDLGMLRHEDISKRLIEDGEIAEALRPNGSGFASDVATVIGRKGPETLYDAVVSSQFDADRLDYMRRDRLMAGVQSGGIDFSWLIDNLEIGTITAGVDESETNSVETFVLGTKSVRAAEAYVLALFQLYPTIYFHKATRAAEKVFLELMVRVISMIRDGNLSHTGLTDTHPLARFALTPDDLETVLALDDTVFWGALEMMAGAGDRGISEMASRMRDRKLPKCRDIRPQLEAAVEGVPNEGEERNKTLIRMAATIEAQLVEWNETNSGETPRILIDKGKRDPYARSDEKGPFNRIHVKDANDRISDISDYSPMIAALRPFEMFRAYTFSGDNEAQDVVEATIGDAIGGTLP